MADAARHPAVLTRLVEVAFPFGFAFDGDLVLSVAGPSIEKVCPGAAGRSFGDVVRLEAPAIPLSFDGFAAHPQALVVLLLPHARGGPLRLRGQLVLDPARRTGWFLGSPWVDDPAKLVSAGLTVEDFAVHDGVLDRLFAAQAGELSRQDAERMDDLLKRGEDQREQLAAAERALAHELEAVPDLLLRIRPDGLLLTVRPSASGELLKPAEHYVGLSVYDAFPELGAGLRAVLAAAGDMDEVLSFEFASGDEQVQRHFEARVARTVVGELLVLVRDVTEQRVLAGRLVHQASHDPLTGLANRAMFTAKVSEALDHHRGDTRRACVLFVDLDDFKQVNDVLGHAAGDLLLVEVAARMRQALRPADLIARLGGDEFAVLLDGVGNNIGRAAAQRLGEGLAQEFAGVPGRPALVTTASIGVAEAAGDDTAATLLSHADVAMYAAKAAGKGCFRVFESGMRDQLLARISAEMELRAALERHELFLAYQPVVDVRTGHVVKVEALVRWQHPHRGVVPPIDFIPVAESSGLIVQLGAWVLHEACRAAMTWADSHIGGAPGVSVNVSARQLTGADLAATVEQALQATGLPAHRLTLEVTETAIVGNGEAVADCLERVHALGVRVSLDDFGTGFSSLSHLRRIPIDELKIDRSFVHEIEDLREARIAEGVLALAGVLGLDVVAEGVETQEQADALFRIGCTLMQGYLFGRPASDEALRAAVGSRS